MSKDHALGSRIADKVDLLGVAGRNGDGVRPARSSAKHKQLILAVGQGTIGRGKRRGGPTERKSKRAVDGSVNDVHVVVDNIAPDAVEFTIGW